MLDFCGGFGVIILLVLLYKIIDHLIRLPRVGEYSNRYILVTGAGRGFGYEITARLDRLGCHVFAGVRNEKSAQLLRESCSSRVEIIFMDVVDSESIKRARIEVENKLKAAAGKELWAIINNAGILSTCRLELLKLEDYEQTLRVNSLGVVDVTQTFLPLIKRSKGRVVNISSGAGRHCQWFFPHYNMSKFALEAYSDCLRRSVKAYGVGVSLVEPGLYKTDLAGLGPWTNLLEQRWAEASEELKNEFGQDYIDKARKFMVRAIATASDRVGDVIDAYEHATLGKYPRARYVVGGPLKYVWLPLQSLPEWLSDFVTDRFVGPPHPAALYL